MPTVLAQQMLTSSQHGSISQRLIRRALKAHTKSLQTVDFSMLIIYGNQECILMRFIQSGLHAHEFYLPTSEFCDTVSTFTG